MSALLPYKATWNDRTTVTQEIREILGPEAPEGRPARSIRRVQILVPTEPKVYGKIDCDPTKPGLNRVYKLPVLSPGAQIKFDLLPEQNFVAAAAVGYAELSIIVEYLELIP